MLTDTQLSKWIGYTDKYVTTSFQSEKDANDNITSFDLQIRFIDGNVIIDHSQSILGTGAPLNIDLTYKKLVEIFKDFFAEVREHLRSNWNEMNTLPSYSNVDLAILYITMDLTPDMTQFGNALYFVEGSFNGTNLVTNDVDINFEMRRGNMRPISWKYL